MVLGTRCLQPVAWEGVVEIRLKPYLEQKTWRLRFKTQDSNFYNQRHEKMTVAEIIWKLIEKYVYPPLDQVMIDLTPPINEVTQLLPFFVKSEQQEKLKMGLKSLRPGPIKVGPKAMEAGILLDLDVPQGIEPGNAPELLTEAEKEGFINTWETWDSSWSRSCFFWLGGP